MSDLVDVTIVGAGPYGLSLAAHLRAAGVRFRQFGQPMRLWTEHMPAGMFLKSQGFASNLSDPGGTHTLGAFCRATGREYGDYGVPVSLETFTAYGAWFQEQQAPDLERTLVTELARDGDGYRISLATGETLRSRQAVVAIGVRHFAHLPRSLAGLPSERCTHSSDHADLRGFRGRDVIVVGAGQSALETATLLHEHGAKVRVLVRGRSLVWNGDPLSPDRSLLRKLREPEAGLGSGWSTWFYSTQPKLFRQLPSSQRILRARTALGPAGAWWLRPRLEGKLSVLLGHSVTGAQVTDDGVTLSVRTPDGGTRELATEHVIAATGFRPDVNRLSFVEQGLRARLRTVGDAPWVGQDFQTSAPGLYLAGPAVASSFGPVMRFVYGADYAARAVARRIVTRSRRSRPVPVGAGR